MREFDHIKEILRANPRGMTISTIADQLKTNRNLVAKYLELLLISGQVEMNTFGPAKVYFLSQRVPLSAMLEIASDSIMVLNRDFRMVQVNDALLKFMDCEKETLLGKDLFKSLPVFNKPEILDVLIEALKGDERVLEISLNKLGNEFFFTTKLIPTTFEDGSPGVTVLLEDITERKLAREALQESKEKIEELHTAANQMESAHSHTNVYYVTLEVAKKILNFDVVSILLLEDDQLSIVATTDETAPLDFSISIHKGICGRTYRTGKSYLIGDITRDPEAKPTNLEYRSTISVPIGKLGVFQAHSARVDAFDGDDLNLAKLLVSHLTQALLRIDNARALGESEAKYRTIFEEFQDIYFQTDMNGTIETISPSVKRIGGYEPDELIGTSVYNVYENPTDRDRFLQQMSQIGMVGDYELNLLKKNGEVANVSINARIVFDNDRKPVAVRGIIRDISERKRSEDQLKEALKREQLARDISIIQRIMMVLENNETFDSLLNVACHELAKTTQSEICMIAKLNAGSELEVLKQTGLGQRDIFSGPAPEGLISIDKLKLFDLESDPKAQAPFLTLFPNYTIEAGIIAPIRSKRFNGYLVLCRLYPEVYTERAKRIVTATKTTLEKRLQKIMS